MASRNEDKDASAATAKLAKIGPMRASKNDCFAPPPSSSSLKEEDEKKESPSPKMINRFKVPRTLIRHLQESQTSDFEVQNMLK